MHTVFRIREFLRYKFRAQSEYKIHSPFVYEFYTQVIRSNQRLPKTLSDIEKIRKACFKSAKSIIVNDRGTGGASKPFERRISDIMRQYANPPKDVFLLYRMIKYLKPGQILELGTSLGISAMYMSVADKSIPLTTIEACPQTAAAARSNFEKLSLNIDLVVGDFDEQLSPVLKNIKKNCLFFFDGNHTREATLRYFDQCLQYIDDKSVFIFDDIYWSPEMKDAWNEIAAHPKVITSIDLFRLGIVFFNKKIAKQHFILKY
ncbi:MAG TPA: class I SAM-dependent methyltransferase [Bacteroidales bacterium]|nr:class I SAM-dependent methyltransferase [Bacteroidales bacterium]